MDDVNGPAMMMMTKWANTPEENTAFGNGVPGRGMEEAMFHHRCYPKTVLLVRPGVDKVGVEGTEGMVAEDLVEAFRIEPSGRTEKHRPLEQIWCLKNPFCIVSLGIQEIRFQVPETGTRYI
jgi:hypothetical protein